MGYSDDMFQKNVVQELMSIRKSCEILAKAAITWEKAEGVNLGLSSISREFPGYSVPEQKDEMTDRIGEKKQLEFFADESDRTPVHLHGGVFDIPTK